jgi:hypothetical protein
LDHYLVLIPYTEEYGHEAQIRRFRDFEENEGVEIAKMQLVQIVMLNAFGG